MPGMGEVHTWQAALLAGERETGVGALVDIVVGALCQELPVLRDDPDLLTIARRSAAANIAVITDLAGGTFALSELEPPPQAVAFARELARRNLPVSDLARAYRVAQRALWHWGTAEIHRRVEDAEDRARAIEELSQAAFATGDVFNSMVMERYAEERERWVRSADALRAATLAELLAGEPVDVARASRRLRYDLMQEHEAFVVWSEDDAVHPEGAAQAIGGARALVVPLAGGIVAGWAPPAAADPAAAPGAHVAFGEPGAGVDGFRASHHEALEARRVARLVRRPAPVVRHGDVALLALLTTDLAQAERFAHRMLGPLADDTDQARRLAATLLTVLESGGSPRRAARRLGVHENTVAKRLRSIDQLVGAPLAELQSAELHAALVIAEALRAQREQAAVPAGAGA